MKKLLLFCFFITVFLNQKIYAQTLTLDELIKIRGMDAESAHSYLSPKGWQLTEASNQAGNDANVSTWSFGQTNDGRIKARLSLFENEYGEGRVYFQTALKTNYELIKSKILAYKMKKVESSVENDFISSTYEGANYEVLIMIGIPNSSGSSSTSYNFNITKKNAL